MKEIAKRPTTEEVNEIYSEVNQEIEDIMELNDALDEIEPLLDSLDFKLGVNSSKRNRVRKKMNRILAKL